MLLPGYSYCHSHTVLFYPSSECCSTPHAGVQQGPLPTNHCAVGFWGTVQMLQLGQQRPRPGSPASVTSSSVIWRWPETWWSQYMSQSPLHPGYHHSISSSWQPAKLSIFNTLTRAGLSPRPFPFLAQMFEKNTTEHTAVSIKKYSLFIK